MQVDVEQMPEFEVKLLPIASIGLPTKWRKVHKAKVDDLARSIEHGGLLQAIGVRPFERGEETSPAI